MAAEAVFTVEHLDVVAQVVSGIGEMKKGVLLHAHIDESGSDTAHHFVDTCDIDVANCSLIFFRLYKELCQFVVLDKCDSGLVARRVDDNLDRKSTRLNSSHVA